MKKLLAGAAVMALCPAAAMAAGLDRSGQPVDILFEDGNYFELSFGRVFPTLEGEDEPLAAVGYAGGAETGDVSDDFNQVGAGVKFQVSERLSFALVADEPYGVDVSYPGDGGSFVPSNLPAPYPPVLPVAAEDGSNNLGGTYANVDSSALTALARYKFNDNFSIHGGLRYQRLEAAVGLSGFAYGPLLSGYTVDFDRDYAFGYAVGAAYEVPEIALRVAVTYLSEIDHELDTIENLPALAGGGSISSVTEITTPQAVNLDFQTGINQRTLLFGQLRYAWYNDVIVSPPYFDSQSDEDIEGTSLTELEDGYSLALGVGRALTDRLSGSVTFGYEHANDDDDLVSPLAPTNGQKSVGVGLSYDVNESLTIAGGVRYVWLGDASAETGTPDTARANFEDSHVVGVGMQVGYRF
ncbi:OmpP1/FadL family transporter [Palleronia sp.]|uniref:OmpP1/FadL family transporter n=1 Tax=Palleronia sp. TaxID=1940284 RepID=UPI0035C86DFB